MTFEEWCKQQTTIMDELVAAEKLAGNIVKEELFKGERLGIHAALVNHENMKCKNLSPLIKREDKLKDAIEKVYRRLADMSVEEFNAEIAEAQKSQRFFALLGLFEGQESSASHIKWKDRKINSIFPSKESGQRPVIKCFSCDRIRLIDDAYRCFHCDRYYCEGCAIEHFGSLIKWEVLVKKLEEYIEFLIEANEAPVNLAYIHGWQCPQGDIDKGNRLRQEIKELKETCPTIKPK